MGMNSRSKCEITAGEAVVAAAGEGVLRSGDGGGGGEQFEELAAGGLHVFGQQRLPVAAEQRAQRGVVDVRQAQAAEGTQAEQQEQHGFLHQLLQQLKFNFYFLRPHPFAHGQANEAILLTQSTISQVSLALLLGQRLEALFCVLVADPEGQLFSGPSEAREHFGVDFWQVEDVSDAVVAVFGVDGPFAEEGEIALAPHLVVLVLVLVYAVARLVPLEDVVQSRGTHVAALGKDLLASCQQLFLNLVSFFASQFISLFAPCLLPETLVDLDLSDQRLCGTGIKNVDDAGLQHFMQSNGIVPAIVEDLDDVLVEHGIAEHFSCEPEGLEVSEFVHVPDVEEEGVAPVVQLHHLHEPAPPQPPLEVHAQHAAPQDVRRAPLQGLEVEDVVGLSLGQRLGLCQRREQQLLQGVGLLEGAEAGGAGEGRGECGVVDELEHGEAEEGVAREDQLRLGLVDQVSVVVLERLADVPEHLLPLHCPLRQLLRQEFTRQLGHSLH